MLKLITKPMKTAKEILLLKGVAGIQAETISAWMEEYLDQFYKSNLEIIKRDIDGRGIRKGQKFKFKFLKTLNKPIELIGSFGFNANELRYEIDIHDNDEYVCLSYVPEVMTNFELI